MLYTYGLWLDVQKKLGLTVPTSDFRNFSNYNDIKKAYETGKITKEDGVVFLRFNKGDQELRDKMAQEGYTIYPNPSFSSFIQSREVYLPYILTKFGLSSLNRLYFNTLPSNYKTWLFDTYKGEPVVLKIGNLHASEGKYLLKAPYDLPHIKSKYFKLPVMFEQFVPDARSIRVGVVGDINRLTNYFISEHVNESTWLKNNNPDKELVWTYNNLDGADIHGTIELLDMVREMADLLKTDILGVDFVINNEGLFLLELNDTIGIPESQSALDLFVNWTKDKLDKHTK